MSDNRIYIDYLHDILNSTIIINTFINNIDYNVFRSDVKTQYAVIRALEIIGEASKKIPAEIKKDSPEIPWREMSGMRDKLIHEYFGVDIEVVWKTATEDIVSVEHLIRKIISKLDE